MSTLIVDVPLAFEYPRDPKDEPYINLAIAAEAGFLASRDRDIPSTSGTTANSPRVFLASE
jgi:predicted nucleic acid-binding protein